MKGYDRLQNTEAGACHGRQEEHAEETGGYAGVASDDDALVTVGLDAGCEHQLEAVMSHLPHSVAPMGDAAPGVPVAFATPADINVQLSPSAFSLRFIMVNDTESFDVDLCGDTALDTLLSDLRAIVAAKTSIPAERQRLIFGGKLLDDNEASLGSLGIQNGSCLHFCPRPANAPAPDTNLNNPETATADAQVAFWRRLLAIRDEVETVPDFGGGSSEQLLRLANSAKLVAAILLFYFMVVLTFMVAVLFKPDEVHKEEDHAEEAFPHWLILAAKVIQPMAAVFGLAVAYTGLKGVVTFSIPMTKRFYYGLIGLTVLQLFLSIEYDADYSKQSTIVGTVLNVAISVVFWGFCCESVRKFLVALQASASVNLTALSGAAV